MSIDSTLQINLVVFGPGQIGSEFIDQVIRQRALIRVRKSIDIRIVAIANSRTLVFEREGWGTDWRTNFASASEVADIPSQIVAWTKQEALDNLILVDNTASDVLARQYAYFVRHGFDIVSSNKRANTLPQDEYRHLRSILVEYGRIYRYETNVGAGLPLIDNIQLLHLSGERISRIYGVFSGSLSYIFNRLDRVPVCQVGEVISEAISQGYAEPDAREDLSGMDVARKLLILARELDIGCEIDDVEVESLVPKGLQDVSAEEFYSRIGELRDALEEKQRACPEGYVLRYTGEVTWDDATECSGLRAWLDVVPKASPVGALTAADCCFEIYTDSYGDRPIVVQGAGAGIRVTARGIFGDVLRIAESKH